MENIDFSTIYSFSRLNAFDKCKKYYYFYYLDPEIAPIKKQFIKPRDYKTKGQAVHDAITLFYHLPVEERTFENLKTCLKESWYAEDDKFKKPPLGISGGFSSLNHERKTYWQALQLLKNFFYLEKEQHELDPCFFLLPTGDIKNSFDDYKNLIKPVSEEFSVSGKFDRIDKLENGNLRIIDFKTGKENQDSSQLEFYKLLAELNFDRKVDKVSFYYLDSKKIKDFDISLTDKEEIKNQVLKKINIIENTENFIPESNKFCYHCDFKELCPLLKNKVKKGIL